MCIVFDFDLALLERVNLDLIVKVRVVAIIAQASKGCCLRTLLLRLALVPFEVNGCLLSFLMRFVRRVSCSLNCFIHFQIWFHTLLSTELDGCWVACIWFVMWMFRFKRWNGLIVVVWIMCCQTAWCVGSWGGRLLYILLCSKYIWNIEGYILQMVTGIASVCIELLKCQFLVLDAVAMVLNWLAFYHECVNRGDFQLWIIIHSSLAVRGLKLKLIRTTLLLWNS